MQHNVRADLTKRRDSVQAMFDHVAPHYDVMNELMSLGQIRAWRRVTTAAIDPRPSQRILDVAAGTGSSSLPLQRAGAQVTCCDLSPGMLAEGRKRYPELTFVQGDALDLPFEDEEFDAVTISYGLRNVERTEDALREFLRVTKPGGRLVIAEFSTPLWTPFRVLYQDYLVTAIPALAKLASTNPSAYVYLAESIQAWPDQDTLADMISRVGWKRVEHKNLTGGIVALHRAWK